MRIFVFILAALAIAKVYAQDQLYRTATAQALINAYSSLAVTACQSSSSQGLKTATSSHPDLWSSGSQMTLQIGRDDLGVSIWQFDDQRWEAAYRQPYLVLAPQASADSLTCTYDITAGRAQISQRG